MTRIGCRWTGYHVEGRFSIEEMIDIFSFERSHAKVGSLPSNPIPNKDYDTISIDIGAFILSRMSSLNLRTARFDPGTIRHFESASWKNKDIRRIPEVDALEAQILSVPQYKDIYLRYLDNV